MPVKLTITEPIYPRWIPGPAFKIGERKELIWYCSKCHLVLKGKDDNCPDCKIRAALETTTPHPPDSSDE